VWSSRWSEIEILVGWRNAGPSDALRFGRDDKDFWGFGMKDGELTAADFVKTLGSGLLAGAAFVAVAMLLESRIIKAGAKLIR
jgi:hypothetical protein